MSSSSSCRCLTLVTSSLGRFTSYTSPVVARRNLSYVCVYVFFWCVCVSRFCVHDFLHACVFMCVFCSACKHPVLYLCVDISRKYGVNFVHKQHTQTHVQSHVQTQVQTHAQTHVIQDTLMHSQCSLHTQAMCIDSKNITQCQYTSI